MPKTTVFLGSSAAAKQQAKAVVKKFTSPTLEFLPWWEAFTAGDTLLKELKRIRAKVDGALLLFSPDLETEVRKKKSSIPNLNVLFEFGYYYGHFGKKKVAMIKYGDFYLPSDLEGYIHIFGSKSFRRGATVKIKKRTETDFTRWIREL